MVSLHPSLEWEAVNYAQVFRVEPNSPPFPAGRVSDPSCGATNCQIEEMVPSPAVLYPLLRSTPGIPVSSSSVNIK